MGRSGRASLPSLMRRRARTKGFLLAAAGLLLAACGRPPEGARSAPSLADLPPPPGRTLARVGPDRITDAELLAWVRTHPHSTPRAALEALVRERLLAQEARRRHLEADPLLVDSLRRAAIQRLLQTVAEEPQELRDVPQAALDRAVEERTFAQDHEELSRVHHVVALLDASAPAASRTAARARLEELRARWAQLPRGESGARAHDAVVQLADQVLGPIAHRAEELQPVERSGRAASGTRYVPEFAAAAAALSAPGALSPIVESSFGLHVMELTERLPAVHGDRARLRQAVHDAMLAERRQRALMQFLGTLHRSVDPAPTEAALLAVEHLDFAGSGAP